MEFAVVAEHNPTRSSDLGKPFVVGRGLRELEFAPRIVVSGRAILMASGKRLPKFRSK